MDGPLEIKDCS